MQICRLFVDCINIVKKCSYQKEVWYWSDV